VIWTDPQTGRRWEVEQLGRIDRSLASGPDDLPSHTLPAGTIVLGFLAVDPPRESRVISGAPENWRERPGVIARLFDEAGRPREDDEE